MKRFPVLVLACLIPVLLHAAPEPPATTDVSPLDAIPNIDDKPLIISPTTFTPEVWEVGDGDGGTFLIKLMDGHYARTNYSRGEHGYLGEQGYWRRHAGVTTVFYDSGWCDVITHMPDGTYTKSGFAPGIDLKGKPSNSSNARQVKDQPVFPVIPKEDFHGVWKLYDENKDVFYLNILPNGTARSSYAGGKDGVFGETGVWRHEGNRILIAYNSGWVNIIVFNGDDTFAKYSYSPQQVLNGRFDNMSTAEKVDPLEAGVTYE